MHRRLQILLVLSSWCLATGVQWDLLQAFAWTRMFAGYAQEQSLGRALASTFAPDNLCNLCSVVQDGKKAQDQQPVMGADAAKFVAPLLPPAEVIVERRPLGDWPVEVVRWGTADRAAPLVPPPRHA